MKTDLHSPAPTALTKLLRPAALLFAGVMAAAPAQALVHLNPDPERYESLPETGPASTLPWDNVGKFTNADGTGQSGSVVSLRGKYCLTAMHVSLRSHVTFDGEKYYARDTSFAPVSFGTTGLPAAHPNFKKADLVIIKLLEDPNLPELPIASFPLSTANYQPLYTIGWGVGNNAQSVTTLGTVWTWGGTANTTAKRWGSHSEVTTATIRNLNGYTYDAVRPRVTNAPTLDSEAALANLDSGAPSFVQNGGQWYLASIASTVTNVAGANRTRFGFISSSGTDSRETNNLVALAPLRTSILAAIPDTSTFEGWLADNGLSGANAAPDADPDGDGMTNLSEFAFATNPKVHDGAKAPALQAGAEGGLVFRYQLSKDATGISVDVLQSADVINWSPLPGTPVVVEENARYAVYEVEVFPNATTGRFYTVKVTLD